MSFKTPDPLPGSKEAEEYRRAQDQFHLVLGYCIAKWADIEEQLFRICWAALRCTPEHAAVVFFRTPTLEARFALTTELLEWVLPRTVPGEQPHPDLKSWKDICAKFRQLAPVRNQLAHHPVRGEQFMYMFEAEEPGEVTQIHAMTDFRSTTSDAKLLRGGVRDELRDKELVEHLMNTEHLSLWMQMFRRDQLPTHIVKLPPPRSPR